MSAQVAADLRAAADVLERDGWTQGSFHSADGCHCVQGAIAVAVGHHQWIHPVDSSDDIMTWDEPGDSEYRRYSAACITAERALGVPCLWMWNDRTERYSDEVIAALRAAAARAEADDV